MAGIAIQRAGNRRRDMVGYERLGLCSRSSLCRIGTIVAGIASGGRRIRRTAGVIHDRACKACPRVAIITLRSACRNVPGRHHFCAPGASAMAAIASMNSWSTGVGARRSQPGREVGRHGNRMARYAICRGHNVARQRLAQRRSAVMASLTT